VAGGLDRRGDEEALGIKETTRWRIALRRAGGGGTAGRLTFSKPGQMVGVFISG